MRITDEDKEIISVMFPGIQFANNFLSGKLTFFARYLESVNNYEFFEPNDIRASISGKFDIVVDLSKSNTYRNVYEVGDKIINIADKLNIELSDLHAMKKEGNSNSVNVCIAGYLEEDHKITFLEFFCESVVPYFCDLVIFEQKGYWQRVGYSHGVAGLLENYTTLLRDSDEMGLTMKCLKELQTPLMAFNFAPYKKYITYSGKLRGFWINIDTRSPDEKLRNLLGRKAFEGLWKLKDNVKKYDFSLWA